MMSCRANLTHAAAVAAGAVWLLGPAVATGATHPEVTVRTVTEDGLRGRLLALSSSEGLRLHTETDGERTIPLGDLVQVTTEASVSPPGRRDFVLTLTNGDRLFGKLVGADDEAVGIETPDLGRIRVALGSIATIDAARATQPAYRASVRWLDGSSAADEDRILLSNGDVVRGLVTRIDEDGVVIDAAVGEAVVPYRRLVAIRFVPARAAPIPTPYLVVVFRSSGYVTVTDLRWDQGIVEGRLAEGQAIRAEAERVARLSVVGGRWEWLATRRPISFEHTPMLSLHWEYINDRNVLGGPMTVGERTFEHGVGVHSRSILTYDLRGVYHQFVTSFGVDDDSGPYADVSVRILIDGQPRFEKTHVRRGALHGPVRLDVKHANRIELVVDFGDNGDVQDRFDWVEAALVR